MTTAYATRGRAPASSLGWTTLLCWITVMLEGFDLVVLGAIIPTLLDSQYLGFTEEGATYVATISLVGVAIGAASVGPMTDRLGRRTVLMAFIAVFSLFTFLVPLANSVWLFGVFRLIAGFGLGACLPTALVLMSESMPVERRAWASTLTMTGYHVGAVLASLTALWMLPDWEVLFYAAGLLGLLVVPLMWFKLPESAAFLQAKASGAAKGRISDLVRPRLRRATIAVWVGAFMGLLLVYGLNTWLPQLMREAGYSISGSVGLLLILNIGAVLGLLLGGAIADRVGTKPVILLWFTASAVLLGSLSIRIQSQLVLNAIVLITGVFVFSAMVLIYAWVTQYYPAHVRGTAMGMTSAVGRLGAIVGPFLTGGLVAADLAYPWGFWMFAGVALLGLLAMLALPAMGRSGEDAVSVGDGPAPAERATGASHAD